MLVAVGNTMRLKIAGPHHAWILMTKFLGLLARVLMAPQCASAAAEATCKGYLGLTEGQRVSVVYGYFEGAHAALGKRAADVLVPPSDDRHPMWWVLPSGLLGNPFLELAKFMDFHCRAAQNHNQTLLDAFLSIAHKKDDSPAPGVSNDKQKTDAWKSILGTKDSVGCSEYTASPIGTRQAIIQS